MSDHIAEASKKVGRPQIRAVFLSNGARIDPHRGDLPDWVYESVFELLEQAAPAVRGEPVAWQVINTEYPKVEPATHNKYPDWAEGDPELEIIPLYAAPQVPPAVQVSDDCPRCNGKGRHATGPIDCPAITICKLCSTPISRNLRGIHEMILSALDRDAADGKAVRGEMAAELRSAIAEQQPAQDVAGLVDALEMSRNDLSEWIASYPDSSHACTANLIKHIDAVLAAHRGQGDEV